MLCVALLLVPLAFSIQGRDASSSSSMRQSELMLEPRSLAVLNGQPAHFSCSTTARSSTMLWRLDENTVAIVLPELGVQSDGPYMAENCSTSEISCWELVMTVDRGNLTRPRRVTCELMSGPQTTADLHIHESGSVEITGGNVSVSNGQTVELQCMALGWFPEPSLEWFLNGEPLSRSLFNTSSELDQNRGSFNTTSTLALEARRSGMVECQVSVSALATPLSANTSVSVANVKDNTVLIAALSYVGAMVGVIILTFCIIVCLRRKSKRKESSLQETQRIDHQRSEQSSVAEETEGTVNAGFSSESSSSFVDTDPSVSIHSRRTTYCTEEMPDVVSSVNPAYDTNVYFISFGKRPVKTTRSVTTV